jgi:major membrane immunogen (membrane-anchored lipoprotein)
MLGLPSKIKWINRKNKPDRIFASRISDRQLIDVTPEYRTATGRILSDDDFEKLADEAEKGYNINEMLQKRQSKIGDKDG